MPNVEGSPAGQFPDIVRGAQAAVQLINDKLGGIGADVAAGTPGRPIRLEVCAHKVDQSEAQACATKVQEANPSLIIVGIDFFTPLMYPLWRASPPSRRSRSSSQISISRASYAFNGGAVDPIPRDKCSTRRRF